jgi:chromosomal replication initiation ATPase DnaA
VNEPISTKSAEALLEQFCAETGYTVEAIRAPRRTAHVLRARRFVAMSLRREGLSYPEIGKLIGRDHTSVMNLCKARAERPAVRLRVVA